MAHFEMTKSLLAVALLASTAALSTPAQANLILNGSFESPTVPVGGFTNYGGGSSVGAWTVVGVDSAVVSTTFAQNGITFQAQDGNQWIDLAGVTSNSQTSGVTQTIATTAGTQYVVTFYVGSATDGRVFFPTTIDLSIDDGPETHHSNPDSPSTALDWLGFSVPFVAQGASTKITFYNGAAANNFNSALDNVSVEEASAAVPEPGSLALLLLGMSAAGTALRRRRSVS